MVKLIGAILSLSMLFGTGAAPASTQVTANVPVTVGKQQAVYEKYSIKTASCQGYKLVFQGSSHGCTTSSGAWDYRFDPKTGNIAPLDYVNISREQDCIFYAQLGIGDISRVVQNWNESSNSLSQRAYAGEIKSATITEEVKGDFIETVTANTGTFPDGEHSDGYWYVFKNLVED